MSNIIVCENCFYNSNCPVQWHKNNAACLTIQKPINTEPVEVEE